MLKWFFIFWSISLSGHVVQEVVPYPKPEKPIGAISQIAARGDSLWLIADGRIYLHNGYDFYPLQPDSLWQGYEALSLYLSDSGLWIGFFTQGIGFYHFEDKSLLFPFREDLGYSPLPDQRVGMIYAVSDTGIWAQTHHFGMVFLSFKRAKMEHFPIQEFGAESQRGKNIISHLIDHPSDANLRLAATLGGLFVFDLPQKTYTRFYDLSAQNCHQPKLCNGNEIGIRYALAKGNTAWLATWGGGLIELDLSTGKFHKHLLAERKNPSQTFENFRRIFWENDSVLGLIDVDLGLVYFNIKKKEFWIPKNSQGNVLVPNVFCESESSYGRFFGGDNQIFLLPRQTNFWQTTASNQAILGFKPNLGSKGFQTLSQQKGQAVLNNPDALVLPVKSHLLINWHLTNSEQIIVVGLRQLFIGNKGSFQEITLPLKQKLGTEAEIISSYFEAESETLWLGTKSAGAFGYHIPSRRWLHLKEGSYRRFWINDIGTFQEEIYFLSEQEIQFYKPETQNSRKIEFREIEGLPKGFIPKKLILGASGELFVLSSQGGLFQLNLAAVKQAKKCLKPKDWGVKSFHEAIQSKGRFYLATSGGLLIWSDTGNSRLLGESYGLGSIGKLHFAKDTLWFLHRNSLCFWAQPEPDQLHKSYPKPLLLQFEVMGNGKGIAKNIALEHHQNWLSWNAVPSDFRHPQQGKVLLKLDGFSDQWREVSASTPFSISNLKPGDYRLIGRTKTTDNGLSPEQLLMEIKIVPAWFQTWWFYSLSALLLFGSALGFYKWRIWQLEARKEVELQLQSLEMRMLRVQMNPHFIFNALNSVKYYILKENKNLASDYLARFSKLLRFILSISQAEKVSLHQEIEGLTDYIEFERIRFNNKFDYKISVAESLDPLGTSLQPMLIQPFVENAIWHGLMPMEEAGFVSISISRQGAYLHIEIDDNGVGREASMEHKNKAHKSFGLNITAERLRAMAQKSGKLARFEITDKTGKNGPEGTRVKITIPYESLNS